MGKPLTEVYWTFATDILLSQSFPIFVIYLRSYSSSILSDICGCDNWTNLQKIYNKFVQRFRGK